MIDSTGFYTLKKRDTVGASNIGVFLCCSATQLSQGQNLHAYTYYCEFSVLLGQYAIFCIFYGNFLIRWDLSEGKCLQKTQTTNFYVLTQKKFFKCENCAKPMSQTYSSDLQHSKYTINIIWQIRKTVIKETAV